MEDVVWPGFSENPRSEKMLGRAVVANGIGDSERQRDELMHVPVYKQRPKALVDTLTCHVVVADLLHVELGYESFHVTSVATAPVARRAIISILLEIPRRSSGCEVRDCDLPVRDRELEARDCVLLS
jgi:hypothetical protein